MKKLLALLLLLPLYAGNPYNFRPKIHDYVDFKIDQRHYPLIWFFRWSN